MWNLVPDQESNPGPLLWKRGVLASGPPGKSLVCFLGHVGEEEPAARDRVGAPHLPPGGRLPYCANQKVNGFQLWE